MKNYKDSKSLTDLIAIEGANPIQQQLFHVERQIEIDGVEMGVLQHAADGQETCVVLNLFFLWQGMKSIFTVYAIR